MGFENILTSEVRRFYPEEFAVGLYARRMIKEKTGVDMPEDEAASIALHILNAQYDISYNEGFKVTQMLGWILDIVTTRTGITIEADSYYAERFVTHLKYLLYRIVRQEAAPASDDGVYEMLMENYPKK